MFSCARLHARMQAFDSLDANARAREKGKRAKERSIRESSGFCQNLPYFVGARASLVMSPSGIDACVMI